MTAAPSETKRCILGALAGPVSSACVGTDPLVLIVDTSVDDARIALLDSATEPVDAGEAVVAGERVQPVAVGALLRKPRFRASALALYAVVVAALTGVASLVAFGTLGRLCASVRSCAFRCLVGLVVLALVAAGTGRIALIAAGIAALRGVEGLAPVVPTPGL